MTSHLSQVCARLGDVAGAARLYAMLAPLAGRHAAVVNGAGYLGAVSHHLGMLAATLSLWDEAVEHLSDAVRTYARLAARPWLALAQLEYALALERRGKAGDEAEVQRLLAESRVAADSLGMRALQRRFEEHERAGGALPVPGVTSGGVAPSDDSGRSGAGSSARAGPPGEEAVLRRDGDYWTLRFDGQTVHLRDARGLHYLGRLLREPGREVHVVEIAGCAPEPVHSHAVDERRGVARQDDLRQASDLGGVGPRLNARALEQYRRRAAELHEEIKEAERAHDLGRIARARSEMGLLEREIAAAGRRPPAALEPVGGGRRRRAAPRTARVRP